ncbi:MAG: YraN family protein [Eubacteriales bacterium]|nr:YraN family protein [Eubacteriales bacterium]
MTDTTYDKGLAGESRAIAYLTGRGMVLLMQRYRSPFGEIDAVMRDGDALVFVEVKARATGGAGTGLLAVGRRKQAKLVKTALQYLAEYGCDGPARFDVIELTAEGVQHIENAFEAGGW